MVRSSVRPVALVITAVAAAALVLSACSTPDTDAGAPDATRTVDHARGATEVPADPVRVITLEPVELDTAVALGVIPVGTSVLSEATGVPAYLNPEAEQIPTVGTVAEPRLEAIAALEPDLILGTDTRHGDFYDQLAAIAPTVFMASQSDPWQDNVRLVGRALGREDRAEEVLGDYTARCAEVAAAHDTAGRTAQLIRPRDDVLTLYGPLSFAGSTLECAGFTTPPRAEWADEISVDLSPELVSQAAADLVLVTTVDPGADAPLPAPIVANPAVFPNPHPVDQASWITGVGPKGGQAVLDDLERILSR
ncbi:ABC transporter substrate-binding protein [Rhodococcoides kroppenstedtii]|uniref:ABC transporter substrate-binding protein n=1 Tax=Rhodococcoides kroppenstedtii TaxID=293050 RepID=UPI0035304BDE